MVLSLQLLWCVLHRSIRSSNQRFHYEEVAGFFSAPTEKKTMKMKTMKYVTLKSSWLVFFVWCLNYLILLGIMCTIFKRKALRHLNTGQAIIINHIIFIELNLIHSSKHNTRKQEQCNNVKHEEITLKDKK